MLPPSGAGGISSGTTWNTKSNNPWGHCLDAADQRPRPLLLASLQTNRSKNEETFSHGQSSLPRVPLALAISLISLSSQISEKGKKVKQIEIFPFFPSSGLKDLIKDLLNPL